MSGPDYLLSPSETDRVVSLLQLVKVEKLVVDREQPNDQKVKLRVHHSLDYLGETCVDRYELVKKKDSLFVDPFFCDAYKGPKSGQKIIRPDQPAQWFSLQTLFLPDNSGPVVWIPESWQKADAVVSKDTGETMWFFANPSLDLARWFWGADGEEERADFNNFDAWRSFALFLRPVEESLQAVASSRLLLPSLQTAGPLFANILSNPQNTPPMEIRNALYERAYSRTDMQTLEKEVRSILFAEYPFLPEKDLENATRVVASWLAKRILFQVAALSEQQKQIEIIPGLVPMTAPISEFDVAYQRRLTTVLLDENAAFKDIDLLRRGYAYEIWNKQRLDIQNPFVTFQEASGFYDSSRNQFDQSVAAVTLANLWKQRAALDKNKRELLSRRLHALLGISMKQEITDRLLAGLEKRPVWEKMNFYLAPTRDNLLNVGIKTENLAEEAATLFVQEKIVSQTDSRGLRPYLLTAPSAFEIVEEFKKLGKEGVGDRKLRNEFGRGMFQSLLDLGGGDFLSLSREARQVLILGLIHFTDFKPADAIVEKTLVAYEPPMAPVAVAEQTEPSALYERWWFWTAAGAVLAAAGGGGYFLWGRKRGDGIVIPPLGGNGVPSGDDDTTTDDTTTTDDDDSTPANNNRRGKGKTVGP